MSHQQLLVQDLGVSEEGHLDVVVTEVMDINKYWINVRATDTLGAREKLMDCMDLFYNMLEGKNMTLEKVYIGCLVAVQYQNEGYHRAEVVSVGQDIVRVNFFDFGTVGDVKKEELRSLPRMFRALPRQAIECFLWGVNDESMQGMARNRFMELVEMGNSCGGFVAIVKTMGREKGDSVGLWLVDTTSNNIPDGLAVNYVLLEEGLVTQAADVGHGSLSNKGKVLSSSCSSLLAAVDEELDSCRYVQKLELGLGELVIHVINHAGEAWVTSQDISNLVLDWQGRDILTPMLSRKKVMLDYLKIGKSTHPGLMHSMVDQGVKGATQKTEQILLYRLVNIPMILNLFMVKKNRQMLAIVNSAVQAFNPRTQFWE